MRRCETIVLWTFVTVEGLLATAILAALLSVGCQQPEATPAPPPVADEHGLLIVGPQDGGG